MNEMTLASAVLITFLFAAGWVLLLAIPLLSIAVATIDDTAEGVERLRSSWSARARPALRGILCVDGLDGEPALLARLRGELTRVLAIATPESRPRACVCVKPNQDAFAGVLRVFNTRGHYLLRAPGDNAATVAQRLVDALGSFEHSFPAVPGTRRTECPECDPKTCPIRRMVRERRLALA